MSRGILNDGIFKLFTSKSNGSRIKAALPTMEMAISTVIQNFIILKLSNDSLKNDPNLIGPVEFKSDKMSDKND